MNKLIDLGKRLVALAEIVITIATVVMFADMLLFWWK